MLSAADLPILTHGPGPTGLLGEALHLGAAILAGGALGLNRNLRGKAAGLRTHALVSLGAALVILASRQLGVTDVTRAVQGVITGVGFLGAGVILHPRTAAVPEVVRGLTTAASVWMAAALGVAAGSGLWSLLLLGTLATLGVLLGGGEVERVARRRLARRRGLERLTPTASHPAVVPDDDEAMALPGAPRDRSRGRRGPRRGKRPPG